MLPPSLNLDDLPTAVEDFRHWFRYPLHAHDFHALRAPDAAPRLLGYYSAKPLYSRLDARGRVDRSAGFNGEIAGVFVPSPARSWSQARLFFARMPRQQVTRADGKRNWSAIRAAAQAQLLHEIETSA